jgi:competence protein ComEC
MKGKLFYAAIVSLFALLGIFESLLLYGPAFLIFGWYLLRTGKINQVQLLQLLVIYFCFACTAIFAEASNHSKINGSETSFVIHFTEQVLFDGQRLMSYANIQANGEQVAVSYRLRTEEEAKELKGFLAPGIVCKVSGGLAKPGQARNPNAFNYQLFLQRKNIHWILEVDGFDLTKCSSSRGGVIQSLKQWRQGEVLQLEEALGTGSAGIVAALLFGDRQFIAPETRDSYERNGTVHLLAISGLHVALLTGMIFFLLIRSGLSREKAEVTLMLFLPFYAVITGLAPSVTRAVLMVLLFLLARRFRIKLSPLEILSIAFMLFVLFSPYSIYNSGFQLSFAVTASLIFSASRILNMFDSYLSRMAAVSFSAQLSSAPILLEHFHEISVISVLANLWFVPLFSFIILPCALIYFLLAKTLPSAAELFQHLLEFIIEFANTMSQSLASIPGAALAVGKPGVLILLYLLAILIFFTGWENRFEGNLRILILIPLVPLLTQLILPYLSPYGKIVFIDVGQGDSILISLPHNQGNYLIDSGGSPFFAKEDWQKRRKEFDTGRDIVLPYLKSEGIRKLDKLILTHGDADHIGGAGALLEELEIAQILIPIAEERGTLEKKVLAKAMLAGIVIDEVSAIKGWEEGENTFIIVSPLDKLEDKNEGSIVLWAELGGKSWLFTGDLGEGGEEALLKNIPGIKADVLKVGHHGSRSSSSETFLDALSPGVAVVSAGTENRYGHPHAEVLERLEERKIMVYRTDRQGAIIYKFRGNTGTFMPWIP